MHLSLTRALNESVVKERLGEALPMALTSEWTMRRQRVTPLASASSELLQRHEAALGALSAGVSSVLRRTQSRAKPGPLPERGA